MAALPEIPVAEAIRTLEVRWILPGRVETAVAAWFGRIPAQTQSREDTYLLWPDLRGLSVKIRGAGVLEVKVYRGSPGVIEVGNARGHLQFWEKWSFPFRPLSRPGSELPGWQPVAKRRRISQFPPASGRITPAPHPGPRRDAEPGCTVELTEVRTRGEAWWSLGFEATGPAEFLRGELEATARLVFARDLPGGVELGLNASRSFGEWLTGRPVTGDDAGT